MALNRRQERLYGETVRVHRKTRNAHGDSVYSVHIETLRCKVFPGINQDQAAAVAAFKTDNMFSFDRLHCEVGIDIRGGDMIERHELNPPRWNEVLGEPQEFRKSGNRNTNYQMVLITITPKPPMAADEPIEEEEDA